MARKTEPNALLEMCLMIPKSLIDVGVSFDKGATEGKRRESGVPKMDAVGLMTGCAVEFLRSDLQVIPSWKRAWERDRRGDQQVGLDILG